MREAHLEGISVVEGFHPAEYGNSVFDAYGVKVAVCAVDVFAAIGKIQGAAFARKVYADFA